MFVCSIVGIAGCLPNGSCQLAVYSQLVTSSVIGPKDEASESGPLRDTLPVEVVTVSTCYASGLIPHDAARAYSRYPRSCHYPNGHGTKGQFKGHLH